MYTKIETNILTLQNYYHVLAYNWSNPKFLARLLPNLDLLCDLILTCQVKSVGKAKFKVNYRKASSDIFFFLHVAMVVFTCLTTLQIWKWSKGFLNISHFVNAIQFIPFCDVTGSKVWDDNASTWAGPIVFIYK